MQQDEDQLPLVRRWMTPGPVVPGPADQPVFHNIPVVPQQDPFAAIPIKPAPASPAEETIKGMQPIDPNDPRFHNSRLRTVLNAIAGGLAGAAGGPKVGAEVGSTLRNMKYNAAVAQQQHQLDLAKEKTAVEKEQFTRAEKEQSLGTQKGTALATAAKKAADTEQAQQKIDTAKREQESKATHRKSLEKYTDWKMANPKQDDFQYIMGIEDADEQKDAIDMFKKLQEAKRLTDEEAAIRAGKIKKAQLDEQIKAGPQLAQVAGQRVRATEAAKAELSPEEESALGLHVKRSLANPDSIQDIAKLVPKKMQARYWTALANEDIPTPLSPKLKETVTSAKTAINHANTISKLVSDPDIKDSLGPIMGRLTEAGNIVGKSVFNTGPAAQKEAELLAMFRYLITFEASSTSGTRPSWQLIKYLEGTSPGARMDEDKLKGSIQAVINSAGNRLAGIYKPSREGQVIDSDKPQSGFNWGSFTVNKDK